MSNGNGINICSQDNIFSAHNLKIILSQNSIKKNGAIGVRIENLVLHDLKVVQNDIERNEYGGLILH